MDFGKKTMNSTCIPINIKLFVKNVHLLQDNSIIVEKIFENVICYNSGNFEGEVMKYGQNSEYIIPSTQGKAKMKKNMEHDLLKNKFFS